MMRITSRWHAVRSPEMDRGRSLFISNGSVGLWTSLGLSEDVPAVLVELRDAIDWVLFSDNKQVRQGQFVAR